jgi:hypothetical protein
VDEEVVVGYVLMATVDALTSARLSHISMGSFRRFTGLTLASKRISLSPHTVNGK